MIRRSGNRFAGKIMRQLIVSARSDAKPVPTFADRARGGEQPKSKLRGASRQMVESMSEKELERLASVKRKKLPTRASRR
jgi:hypothetical protein